MIYIYDGSFEGLLTVIFDSYKVLEDVDEISEKTRQIDFFADKIEVEADKEKADRVKNSVIKNFKFSFYNDMIRAFSSCNEEKEIVIARTLKKLYTHGFSYINSADSDVVKFRNILQRLSREVHAYKGLLRFNEYDGILFAKFTPENDILNYVYNHFKKRLKNEKFIIADTKRKKAVLHSGHGEFIDFTEAKDFKIEDEYVDLWREFYDSIGIEERKSEKLRISNMPKKYWKNLPEMNRLK